MNSKNLFNDITAVAILMVTFVLVLAALGKGQQGETTPNEDTSKMITNRYTDDGGPRPVPLCVPKPLPLVFTERHTPPQYYQYVVPMQQPAGSAVAEAPPPSPHLNPHVKKVPYVNWMPYTNE